MSQKFSAFLALVGICFILFSAKLMAAEAAPMSVFIFAGQSNACGGGSEINELPNYRTDSPILYFYKMLGSIRNFDPAVEANYLQSTTLERLRPVKSGRFGSEITLAESLHASGRYGKVLIVKVCAGSSNMYEDWISGNRLLYEHLVPRVNRALALARGQGYAPRVRGFFWIQGESDVSNQVTNPNYGSALNLILSHVRSTYGHEILSVTARIRGAKATPVTDVKLASIRDQQSRVGNCDDRNLTVNVDDTLTFRDGVHWKFAAHAQIGRRMAQAFNTLENIRLQNRTQNEKRVRCAGIFESDWEASLARWQTVLALPTVTSETRTEIITECRTKYHFYKWYLPELQGTTCADHLR